MKKKFQRRNNAMQVVVYDLQGGPLPDKLHFAIERAVEEQVKNHDGIAYTVVVE